MSLIRTSNVYYEPVLPSSARSLRSAVPVATGFGGWDEVEAALEGRNGRSGWGLLLAGLALLLATAGLLVAAVGQGWLWTGLGGGAAAFGAALFALHAGLLRLGR